MGVPLRTHKQDVDEVKKLVGRYPVLSRYLSHHIKTSIVGIRYNIELGKTEVIKDVTDHMLADLEAVDL